ncbi:juvenile hormone esterase-like [Bicyclus anynana]|uniref:Carboxylic ester hydrolase n=1 Tax=Bicyclus anynana TaxID=110368 RepID=A0A6J1N2G1_BICAN|nr:juvenile hormone esterase-like [Bicyclus anynana]
MDSGRVIFVFALILQYFSCTVSFVWTGEINLPQGKVRGKVDWQNGYNAYLGIPYASVTKRFQEANPAPKWSGTMFATNGSINCNQYSELLKTPVGQEDCLVANVFTPIRQNNDLLPVMVFVHGGGFDFGSNSNLLFNPKYFIQKDVIVVTINYRVGAFGFLCLYGTEATGNIGLKDQLAALQWIKDNIQAFGGNPNTMTVFGESAGATAIHYMITTGKHEGLFDKAILQSGTVLMPNKIDPNPVKTASMVASKMGFNSEDPKELLEIFQNASTDEIIKASRVDAKNQPLKLYLFRPCVESPVIENKSFITAYPKQLVDSPICDTNLDIILGYNNKEGIKQAGQYDSNGLKNLNSTLSDIIPENILFTNESEKEALTEEIRKFYFKKGIDHDSLIDYFSDTVIMYPSFASGNSLLSSNIRLYNYFFKYDSFRNLYKSVSGLPQKPGATHADELFYMFDPLVFNLVPLPAVSPTPEDLKMINTITTLWTNFAKRRRPSSCTTADWNRSKKGDLQFLQLDSEVKMIPLPNPERLLFWDRVYKRYSSL